MKKAALLLLVLSMLIFPVNAMEFQAPEVTGQAAALMPETADSFGEGLWNVLRAAITHSDSSLREAMSVTLSALTAVLICALIRDVSGAQSSRTVELAGTVAVAGILITPSSSLISLGMETATQLSEYGKLLLPVMTGAMAAQGGMTSSAALYAGTALFDGILSSLLSGLMKPMLSLYLALSIANSALEGDLLGKMRDFIRWAIEWVLKIVLYLFTGYMTVTGVVSGNADAAAVRAAKITISGAVPVVGGILSDASEAVLVTAGSLGSAAGVYGLLAVLALFAGPFLRIGIQYLLLKAAGALSTAFDGGSTAGLINDFSGAMGLLLAMVSSQTVLLMISTMCLMKGVG